jgi:hypothetical protein
MARRFAIAFEEERPVDEVLIAVAPIDALTGRIVRQNVDARIDDFPFRPIRNLSGLLVFLKPKVEPDDVEATEPLPDRTTYSIRVTAEAAGYFDPEPIEFVEPLSDDVTGPKTNRRKDVPLHRLPTYPFESESTLISGVLVNGENVVQGARIWAILPAGSALRNGNLLKPFETKSDRRGAFALPLRLPALEDSSANPVTLNLHFQRGSDGGLLKGEVDVLEGRRHVFKKPVDMAKPELPELLIL